MNWIDELRNRLAPWLESLAREIQREFSNVRAQHTFRLNEASSELHAGVSCILQGDEDPDLVDLLIRVEGLPAAPRLVEADVCWAHPSGYVEYDALPKPTLLTDAALSDLVTELQPLATALRAALQRRRPAYR